jgi:K+-sensing histidine kinase KdpD
MARKGSAAASRAKSKTKTRVAADTVAHMRTIAHDLSNALEAIMQASYLLAQSKLDENPKRWADLIDSSSQQAARLNRDLRKLLRALSEE